MSVTPELLIIGAVAGIGVLAALAARRSAERPYETAGPLLSPAEQRLLDSLRAAVAPELVVFPRIRLGDVVQVRRQARGKRRQVARARIADVHVGFLACDAGSLRVRAVVELDAGGHRTEARRARDHLLDSVLGAAQVPLVRLAVRETYEPAALRDAVCGGLRPAPDAAGGVPAGVVTQGAGAGVDLATRLSALRAAAVARLQRELPAPRTLIALGAGALGFVIGAAWLLANGPSSRPSTAGPVAAASGAPPEHARPTLRDVIDSLLKRSSDDRPKPLPAAPLAPAKKPPAAAPPAEPPREIVGWREEKVPGKPLEQCLGPDHEINPEVVRCRSGYTQRVPVYR